MSDRVNPERRRFRGEEIEGPMSEEVLTAQCTLGVFGVKAAS